MKPIIQRYSTILFALFVVEWWLIELGMLPLPEYIPGTTFKIGGLVILTIVITCLIFLNKELLRRKPDTTLLQLMSISLMVGLIGESAFQLVRQLEIQANSFGERVVIFSKAVALDTVLFSMFAFAVAFQLKTKKLWILFLGAVLVITALQMSGYID